MEELDEIVSRFEKAVEDLKLAQQGTIYCLDDNFKDTAIKEIGEERLINYLKES